MWNDEQGRCYCYSSVLWIQAALQHGIESLSQAEVGSALQVYFNLGLLTQVSGLLPLRPSKNS